MATLSPDDLALIDIALLTPQLKMLIKLIGLPLTLHLLENRGGTQLYIPSKSERSDTLNELLPPEAVSALVAHYAERRLDLPKNDKVIAQIRNVAINRERGQLSAAKLAHKYKLTRRQIINICKTDADTGQLDLFKES